MLCRGHVAAFSIHGVQLGAREVTTARPSAVTTHVFAVALWCWCRDHVYGFTMAPIQALAMSEPLVDTVDPEQVGPGGRAVGWLVGHVVGS